MASHNVESNGVTSTKSTTFRVGYRCTLLAIDLEGPKIATGNSVQNYYGNIGPYMEASLFRIEAKLWALRVRIEPNIHSGIGLRDGQVQVKLAGFGLSFGNYGIGVSTPLGGIGSGKF